MIRLRTAIPVLLLALAPAVTALAQQPCTPVSEVSDCEDFNDCTIDACDPLTLTCVHEKATEGDSCSDGNGCTPDDTCQEGECVAGAPEPDCIPCAENDDCEDGSDCTVDTCDLGRCEREGEEGGTCDDADPCTVDDRCTDDVCAGSALVCDDGVPCTLDFCDADAGACTSQAESALCPAPSECAASECRPDDLRADSQGCVSAADAFEQAECTEDENPCTVDRCRTGVCAHDGVPDPQGCSPLVPSYRRAVTLRGGVGRVLTFVVDEVDAGGETGDALVEQLSAVTAELDAAVRVLAGRDAGGELPAGALRGLRLAEPATTAQVRGLTAFGWLRGTPGRVQRFMRLVSGGRRRGDLDPDNARELRRNGRILLTETKALKRDVKKLQRTFSVFQR